MLHVVVCVGGLEAPITIVLRQLISKLVPCLPARSREFDSPGKGEGSLNAGVTVDSFRPADIGYFPPRTNPLAYLFRFSDISADLFLVVAL